MKKVISLLLSLALLSGCFTAFAVQTEVATEPLYFNDFENCNFPGTEYFSVTDTGDEAHGKAMKASYILPDQPGKGYAAITGSQSSSGKYVRNGVEYKTFNEALNPNTDYILGFMYKVTDTELYHGSALGALSFAPQIEGSRFQTSSDYKYYLPVVTDWKQEAVLFNSNSASTINIKVNTQGSNVTTWVDNYGIYEPVALTVKGMEIELDITEGVYTEGYLGKGSSFKASAPAGLDITSVTMNGEEVQLVDGKIDIASVTGPVVVSLSSSLEALKKIATSRMKTSIL